MLEESKERLDGPAMLIDQRDDLGRDVKQVRGDQECFSLSRSSVAGPPGRLASRVAGDLHNPHRVIAQRGCGLPAGETHPDIADDLRLNGFVAEGTVFQHLEGRVFPNATDERRADVDDLAEQIELEVSPIHDVDASRFQIGCQYLAFVGVAIGQVHPHRNALEQLELGVQLEGFVSVVEPHGLDQFGECRQQRAIDQRQHTLDAVERRGALDRLQCIDQLTDDAAQQIGVKDTGRFGERTQRRTRASENTLNFLQLTRLLDSPQTTHDGVEEVQQDQCGVLIEVQLAVSGLVAGAAVAMKVFHHRQKQFEVLEAVKVLLLNLWIARTGHAGIMRVSH